MLTDTLRDNFLKHVETLDAISKRGKKEFRLATYNVHYFTDIYEKNDTVEGILKDIKTINADCIGLQEIILGDSNIKINDNLTINMTNLLTRLADIHYKKLSVCNSVPSWFTSIYGNMLLVKDKECEDVKCLKLHETIHTFDKSKSSCVVSGDKEGTCETRCYIKIYMKYKEHNLIIINTHLDVATEDERVNQITEIIEMVSAERATHIIFIMGDFNTFNRKTQAGLPTDININPYISDNGKVIAKLESSGFFDCHSEAKDSKPPLMTAWNNTKIDFIFCSKKLEGDYRAEVHPTKMSDHLPVVLTLTPNTKFIDIKQSTAKNITGNHTGGSIIYKKNKWHLIKTKKHINARKYRKQSKRRS